MNSSWVTLAVVSILGITKLLSWWLGKPRKIEKLRKERAVLHERLRHALQFNDTVAISNITIELERVRKALLDLDAK